MYKRDPLIPNAEGDQNNVDEKGRVKVHRNMTQGQIFLGSKVNFHDVPEGRDYLAHASEFSSDGMTIYLVVQFEESE